VFVAGDAVDAGAEVSTYLRSKSKNQNKRRDSYNDKS
jgi:hypothetical protein